VAGIEKLTVTRVRKIQEPGKYGDGNGLYLQVTKHLSKSWVFRYQHGGTEHNIGLGPAHTVSLAEARIEARKARSLLAMGIDPLFVKKAADTERRVWNVQHKTFAQCCKEYIEGHQDGWRSEKHRQQWIRSLRTYTSTSFGRLPVAAINTQMIMDVLKPIWTTKTETAVRLRERIERILSYAATAGYRTGENPARWRGHLEELLPKPSKVWKVRHHPAMPYTEISAFYQQLQAQKCMAARALELTILTASRSGEVIRAQWTEIDFSNAVWTIPGNRMKSGREHRIPLSRDAIGIFRLMWGLHTVRVFPGLRESAMLSLLRRTRKDITVHGFRSTFRVWAAEMMKYPREIAECALAHNVAGGVVGAYLRSDFLEQRKKLMRDWATWCTAIPEERSTS
jgi:integrase